MIPANPAAWHYQGACIDGEAFRLRGYNLWACSWQPAHESVPVTDPLYGPPHRFGLYTIVVGTETIEFTAGEFSNCVWGFHTRPDEALPTPQTAP